LIAVEVTSPVFETYKLKNIKQMSISAFSYTASNFLELKEMPLDGRTVLNLNKENNSTAKYTVFQHEKSQHLKLLHD
jgi:hypothetical protein